MTGLLGFLAERRVELWLLVRQHVLLVAVSAGLACLAGIPLGIALARRPRLARGVLAVASVAQTIPSLALFGFLIPIPFIGGIGVRTAVVALVLYALLPILRNTCTGIQQVDPAVSEAATAMGMTSFQRLRLVELPLALPVILAGVRVATVLSVGTATIAAAIGAGGLGTYVFRGLATVDTRLILAGAIPAAALALVADGLLGAVQKSARPGRRRRSSAALRLAASRWRGGAPRPRRVRWCRVENFTERWCRRDRGARLEQLGSWWTAAESRGTSICHAAGGCDRSTSTSSTPAPRSPTC